MRKLPAILAMCAVVLVSCGDSDPAPGDVLGSLKAQISSNIAAADAAAHSGASGPLEPNPSVDVAKSWMGKWCDVQPGMTRAQVRDIMGSPTQEFDLASGSPSMSWSAFEFMFNAFMNSDDVVRQLDVNDLRLTDTQRAQIPCEFIRTLN